MLSVRKSLPVLFSLLSAAVLLLTACAPAAGSQSPALATSVPVIVVTSAPAVPVTAPTATQAPPAAPTSSIPETVTPTVKVSDQAITDGTVTVSEVDSPGPGWIVIHINSGGNPGPIIGWTQVNPGVNTAVSVKIDPSKATPVLYAMLHTDAGVVGTYEFPGPDTPVQFNGQMVSPAFAVTGGLGQPAASTVQPTTPSQPTAAGQGGYGSPTMAPVETSAPSGIPTQVQAVTVSVADNPKLGKILVDTKGMTLYIFKNDTPGVSNCSGGCAENWPPLLTTGGSPVGGPGVTGTLKVLARSDNGVQVTYNNQPLYYFAGDQAPGDVNGQGVGNKWFAATP